MRLRHVFALVLFALSALVVGEARHPAVALAAGSLIAVVGTVAVGATPDAIAVDSATHRAYVANRVDGSVSVVSSTGWRIITTVPVGNNPEGIAVDTANNVIYVANNRGDTVSVIDGATNRVVATIPTGRYPSRVAVEQTFRDWHHGWGLRAAASALTDETAVARMVGIVCLAYRLQTELGLRFSHDPCGRARRAQWTVSDRVSFFWCAQQLFTDPGAGWSGWLATQGDHLLPYDAPITRAEAA